MPTYPTVRPILLEFMSVPSMSIITATLYFLMYLYIVVDSNIYTAFEKYKIAYPIRIKLIIKKKKKSIMFVK